MFTNDIGLLTNERCAMVLAIFFRLNGKGESTLSQKDLVSGVFQNFGHCDLEINTYKIIYKSKLTVCQKGLRYLEQSSLREICNSLLKQLNTIYYNSTESKDIDLRNFLARKLFNAPSRTLNRKESDKGGKKGKKAKFVNLSPDYPADVDNFSHCWHYNGTEFLKYETSSSTIIEKSNEITGKCAVDKNSILVLTENTNVDNNMLVFESVNKIPVKMSGFSFGTYSRNAQYLCRNVLSLAQEILPRDQFTTCVQLEGISRTRNMAKDMNLLKQNMSNSAIQKLFSDDPERTFQTVCEKVINDWTESDRYKPESEEDQEVGGDLPPTEVEEVSE